MKKNNTRTKVLLYVKLVVLTVPFFIGLAGFLQMGLNGADAAYASFQCYFANIDASPENGTYNVLVEICRWYAPFAAILLGISFIVDLVSGELWPRITGRIRGHYVVYGSENLISELGLTPVPLFSKYYLARNDQFIASRKYLLLFDNDKDSLDCYMDLLLPYIRGKKDVTAYMNICSLEQQDIHDDNLVTFQLYEYIAKQFFMDRAWIDYMFDLLAVKKSRRISMIGFEDLGRHMLESAMVLNLINSRQAIEYHVWGDVAGYRALNEENLSRNMELDRIVFHEDSWQSGLPVIADSDCIILCGRQAENLIILSDILRLSNLSGKNCRVYVFVRNPEILHLFEIKHFAVKSANDKGEKFLVGQKFFPITVEDPGSFIKSVLDRNSAATRLGREKHGNYVRKCRETGAPGTQYYDWEDLNGYLRQENQISAEYDMIRNYLFDRYRKFQAEHPDRLTEQDILQILKNLEHVRWRRSHALSGWTYDENRNDALKQHYDMVDYSALSAEEKDKDDNFVYDSAEKKS